MEITARQEILPPSLESLKVSRSLTLGRSEGTRYSRFVAASAFPADLDRLYQLPLDEFTAARNVLAKGAGKNAAAIRALTKPPLAAWAVNQLYWRERRTWDALVAAADNQRRTNKAMLAGRAGDVRAAGKVHDEAVQDALKTTLDILSRDGHPVTDATKQSIVNTLRALPADEPPGRLTRVLQPGGFEMLAGLTITKATKEAKTTKEPAEAKGTKDQAQSKADAKALTQAREAAASAERAVKEAEQAARRHEFEIARATRDEERAAKAVEQARVALDQARAELAAAERDLAAATERRELAEEASTHDTSAVDTARRAAATAAAALKKLS